MPNKAMFGSKLKLLAYNLLVMDEAQEFVWLFFYARK